MTALTFLVVDDATFIRDMLKRHLRDYFPGCEVVDAATAKKAQALLQSHRVDLILCDWEMPEMTGEEFLRWVRGESATPEVPFIMVTSRGERDYIVKAVEAGVSDYLGKPFKPETLVGKVNKTLEKAGVDAPARQPESAQGFGGASVDVLTGGRSEASPPAGDNSGAGQDSVGILTGGERNRAPAGGAKSRPAARGQATLTFTGFSSQCVIKDISLQKLSGVIKRGDQLPALLDSVVISIVQDDGEDVARLNGYVHALQAAENRVDTDVLKITLRFIDDDPQKLEQLSRYIGG